MAFSDEVQAMMDDIVDTGTGFGQSVTVRVVSAGAWNAATGVRGEGTADGTVAAVRHERRTDHGSAQKPDVQEVMYTVRVSELTTVKRGNRLIDGSQTLYIHRVDRVALDKVWEISCRTVKPV